MRRRLFRNSGINANTLIGGLGSSITTASALAAKLRTYPLQQPFPVNSIQNFTIVGNDIRCDILEDYEATEPAAFRYCSNFTDSGNHLKRIYGAAVFQEATMPKLELNGLVDIQGYRPFNLASIDDLIFKNLVSTFGNAFASNGVITFNSIDIRNCSTLGLSTGDNSCFVNTSNGVTIYAKASLQTNNEGSPDGDLQYAIANGATVIYI